MARGAWSKLHLDDLIVLTAVVCMQLITGTLPVDVSANEH